MKKSSRAEKGQEEFGRVMEVCIDFKISLQPQFQQQHQGFWGVGDHNYGCIHCYYLLQYKKT